MPNYRVIGRPFKGRAVGEAIRLTHVEGRALVAMKRVEIDDGRRDMQAEDPASGESAPDPAPAAKKVTKRAAKKATEDGTQKATKKTAKATKKGTKRTYRRRDMQAEG